MAPARPLGQCTCSATRPMRPLGHVTPLGQAAMAPRSASRAMRPSDPLGLGTWSAPRLKGATRPIGHGTPLGQSGNAPFRSTRPRHLVGHSAQGSYSASQLIHPPRPSRTYSAKSANERAWQSRSGHQLDPVSHPRAAARPTSKALGRPTSSNRSASINAPARPEHQLNSIFHPRTEARPTSNARGRLASSTQSASRPRHQVDPQPKHLVGPLDHDTWSDS